MPVSSPAVFNKPAFNIPLGTAGTVLTSNGNSATTPPTFQAGGSGGVTQITSTGGTVTVTPSGGTGIVNLEATGTPIASLPDGTNVIALTDVLPFESLSTSTTEKVTVQVLLGLGPIKEPINAVSVSNIASLSGLSTTVDGVALSTAGLTVLLTAQTTASQNGPWSVQSGAWTRPAFYTSGNSAQAYAGCIAQSLSGTTYSGTFWKLTTTGTITIDTTATTWTQITISSGLTPSPAGTDTQIQYNASGVLTASSGLAFLYASNTLTVGNTSASGTITTPATGASSTGLALSIVAGAGGSSSGAGGNLTLKGGNNTAGSGAGGALTLATGSGGGTGAGGALTIQPGNAGVTGNGGTLTCTGGQGGTTSGTGGGLNFTAGLGAGSSSGNGGRVRFTGGASTNFTGGSVQFVAGTNSASTPSLNGVIQFFNGQSLLGLEMDQYCNVIVGAGNAAVSYVGGYGASADQGYVVVAASTGGSTQVPNYTTGVLLEPSGTIAAYTVTMPASPIDGQICELSTTALITALTVSANSGQTLIGGSISNFFTGAAWKYNLASTQWNRRW